MLEITENPKIVERAYLVGARPQGLSLEEAEEHLEELAQLVDTMGVPVVARRIVSIGRIHPALLLGTGAAEEIHAECQALEADCIVFDDDLSPSQQRNWERMTKLCVIDRREVILDIFAQRAQTREARLQTQLARLEYSLPRLRRAWTHLERQRGGARAGGGARARGGGGELQLQVDQRLARNQIAQIKRELALVRKRRSTQRKMRGTKPTPVAAIVGYTNAGKSTLLRALTGADVLVEDKLFATLDTTTRRVALPNCPELLLSDTVGFIRKLPHDLIDAFRATLEEAALADVLIHVVDASHPNAADQIEVAEGVLRELGAFDKPMVLALNKIDRLEDGGKALALRGHAEHVVRLSALTGQGFGDLMAALDRLLADRMERVVFAVPPERYDLAALAHREGKVIRESHIGGAIWIEADLPRRLRHKIENFLHEEMPETDDER